MAYTLTGRKSGTVRIIPDSGAVTSESEGWSSSVTKNPIEDGSEISDHVVNSPASLSLSGVLVGGENAKSQLKAIQRNRDLVTYTGRIRLHNLVITGLSFDYDSGNRDGSNVKVSLQQVKVAGTYYLDTDTAPMSVQDRGKSSLYNVFGSAGMQYVQTQNLPDSAYEKYLASYTGSASSAPSERLNPSYSGVVL